MRSGSRARLWRATPSRFPRVRRRRRRRLLLARHGPPVSSRRTRSTRRAARRSPTAPGTTTPGRSARAWPAPPRAGLAARCSSTVTASVTVPNSASLNLTTGMTLEAWVFPTASTGWATTLMKEQTSGLAYSLYASSSANRPIVYFNTGNKSTTRHRYLSGPAALPLNTWSHLAATYDGVTLRLYVNGAQVSSQPHTGSIITSTGALRIGGDSAGRVLPGPHRRDPDLQPRALAVGDPDRHEQGRGAGAVNHPSRRATVRRKRRGSRSALGRGRRCGCPRSTTRSGESLVGNP